MQDTTMRYMQRNAGNLNKLEEQISSQQKINRPSDNPIGFTNAMNYRNILSALGQQKVSMEDGEIYMNILETTHKNINSVFGRCQDLAVQAASDTEKHQERLFTNMEIRELLEEMVSLAQTKHKDSYMFTGKWTNQPPYEIKSGAEGYIAGSPHIPYRAAPLTIPTSNPPPTNPDDPSPFEGTPPVTIQLFDREYMDPNIRPQPDHPMVQRIIPGTVSGLNGLLEKSHLNDPETEKADYEIDYVNGTITLLSNNAKAAFYDDNGDPIPNQDRPVITFDYIYRNSIDMSGEIYREVSTGITMKINTNPDDLFGKGGQGQTDSFKEIISLMQGLWYNDQPQINKSINELNTGRERNLELQAVEGARQSRLATIYDRNWDLSINNTAARSALEDVDLTETLTDFAMADAVYNASLQAAARIMQKTLMDYL